MTRKLVVEGIGTFFLILTVGLTVLGTGAGALAPIAIGLVLMAMVYAGGHISGAHYNPAVSVGVWIRGRATTSEMAWYSVVQLAAAAAAAVFVGMLKDWPVVDAVALETAPAFLAELLFTFALVFVILNVATARGTEGNSYFGLAIGLTVMAGAFAVGPISGAAFNPAVALALVLMGVAAPGALLLYLPAQIAAGAAAALLFNALDLGSDKPTTATPAEQAALRGAAET